jgi:hypothetical protein
MMEHLLLGLMFMKEKLCTRLLQQRMAPNSLKD